MGVQMTAAPRCTIANTVVGLIRMRPSSFRARVRLTSGVRIRELPPWWVSQ
jgi:hypothetical protein